MLKTRRAPADDGPGIDMSPLIDMTFILLIFFVVSATFTKDLKLELERPGAQSAAPANEKSVRVHIDQRLDLYVDGQPVRAWMVESRVKDALRARQSGDVLVVVDRRVPAETLVEVVDACRLAGAAHVGVATDREAP
jgi:biopolymer transport protein ExbD